MMGRHPDRIALAREFGATEIVSERADEAIARIRQLTKGFWCARHSRMRRERASHAYRNTYRAPGGAVGRVGVPLYDGIPETRQSFYDNIIVAGGRIQPGRVFDRTIDLARVPDGYRAMNDRQAIKVMIAL